MGYSKCTRARLKLAGVRECYKTSSRVQRVHTAGSLGPIIVIATRLLYYTPIEIAKATTFPPTLTFLLFPLSILDFIPRVSLPKVPLVFFRFWHSTTTTPISIIIFTSFSSSCFQLNYQYQDHDSQALPIVRVREAHARPESLPPPPARATPKSSLPSSGRDFAAGRQHVFDLPPRSHKRLNDRRRLGSQLLPSQIYVHE